MPFSRTQIRVGALTGSVDDTLGKTAVGALNADSLQAVLDNIVSAQSRMLGFAAPAGSYYSVDKDVLSVAAAPVISGSLEIKNGSGDIAAQTTITGYVSGSGIRVGALLGTSQDILGVKNADMIVGFGPHTTLTNKWLKLEATRAGTAGGVRAEVQTGGGSFSVFSSADAANSVASISSDGTLSGSSLTIGGTVISAPADVPSVKTSQLLDSNGDIRANFLNAGNFLIKNQAGSANVLEIGDTVITATGVVTASGGVQITGTGTGAKDSFTVAAGNSTFAGNVTITNDLTVNGTTTTIDTDNLVIQDSIIGMGISGSGIPGPAADRALMFCIKAANGNATLNPVLTWQNTAGQFAFAKTNLSVSGSGQVVPLTSDADLRLGSLFVKGTTIDLDVATNMDLLDNNGAALSYRFGTDTKAKWITTNTSEALQLEDDVRLNLGDSGDGSIRFLSATDDLVISGSGTTDIRIGVDAGDSVALEVDGAFFLRSSGSGGVQLGVNKLVGGTGMGMELSSSAGGFLRLSSPGDQIQFWDGYKIGSDWTDANPLLLASADADYVNYRATFGEVSLLSAINTAANSASTRQKKIMSISGSQATAGQLLSTATGATTTNMSSLTMASRAFVDVYVNGQLMRSGSEPERALGTVDYNMVDASLAAVDFKFAFNIIVDDTVIVAVP